MRVVLFLGAGFSTRFGLPTMNNFFEFAYESNAITQQDKKFIRDLRRLADKGVCMVTGFRANLEHVLSYALASPDREKRDRLCSILSQVFARMNLKDFDTREIVDLKTFLGHRIDYWHDFHELTVITTNYDVCAEFAFHNIGLPLSLPSNWASMKEKSDQSLYGSGTSKHKICKLHGSINWFKDPLKDSGIQVQDGIAPAEFRDEQSTHMNVPRVCIKGFNWPEHPPIIAPPTFFKPELPEGMKQMWTSATQAFESADQVVFIGYSFPPSDTEMRYFLGRSLAENPDLKQIDILDPDAVRIVDRLQDPAAGYGDYFHQILRAHAFQWQAGNYQLSMTKK